MCVRGPNEGSILSQTGYCGVKRTRNGLEYFRGETEVICKQTAVKDCYNEHPAVLCCSGDDCNYGLTSTQCSDYSSPKTKCPTSTFANAKVTGTVHMANCHPKDHPYCSATQTTKGSDSFWEYHCSEEDRCKDIKDGCKELPEEAIKLGFDKYTVCCKPMADGAKLSTKWGERVAAGGTGMADEKTDSSARQMISVGIILVLMS